MHFPNVRASFPWFSYADLAADFRRWTQATTESVADTHFGFSLEEVEAWAKVEEVENKKFNEEAKVRYHVILSALLYHCGENSW